MAGVDVIHIQVEVTSAMHALFCQRHEPVGGGALPVAVVSHESHLVHGPRL
jgi:hypothetical protein